LRAQVISIINYPSNHNIVTNIIFMAYSTGTYLTLLWSI